MTSREKSTLKAGGEKAYLHCFHGEPDSFQIPPGYLINKGAWLRIEAESFPSVICIYIFFSCKMLIMLLWYCETMCSVAECPMKAMCLSLDGREVAHKVQFIDLIGFVSPVLWHKDI